MTLPTRYPRHWEWPNKAKIAISVNLAFEAFLRRSQYSQGGSAKNEKDYFSLSFAEYGVRSGAWRLMELLDEVNLRGSMSTNGLAAETHPEIVRAFVDQGNEVVGHGWANDELADDDDADAELKMIQRCTKALKDASGGIAPVGWTSPGSAGSRNTLGFLRGEGYLWNGDEAADDLPYLRETKNGTMVIMPRTNMLHNDLAIWLSPKNPPSILWEGFKDTFDTLYAEGGRGSPKWTEITLHCHIAGRPTLIPTVRKCLQYAKGHDGVWFALKRDIAKWALQREGKP
jgi:peptidoglycan/xylan/chitin deacetylase (PgdA/CDA1 family)